MNEMNLQPPPYVEPTAEFRDMAKMFRSAYNAYVESGFTAAESMYLIKASILANGTGGRS
jgi:hypothetical protein